MSGAPTNDGGPAFPLENPRMLEDGDLFRQYPGMSLRDYFAGQALAVLLPESINSPRDLPVGWAAGWAYRYADAMLAARGVVS